ncbi:glycosyltransferase [Candidatus Pelagibacter sp.]|nr:glycosyltransferase [Candidatus Pelagibacter sp.]
MKIKILIPIFNDFESVSKLLMDINSTLSNLNADFSVILVNDASTEKNNIDVSNTDKINSIKIINIKNNQGHARCIATGLKYIFDNEEFDYIIPMDGDGEDRPQEISKFVEFFKYDDTKPIVGERIKRSEGLVFKISYNIHKLITFIFTGHSIKFGNYTCLPKSTVEKMINEKATWSSFSGALAKLEKNRSTIPSIRGERYFGPSKMSFFNLIKHSLSIIAVFKTNVIIRSILFFLIYIFLISENLSYVTSIPLIGVLALAISVLAISKRENISELNDSLSNIKNIDEIK